MLIKESAKVRDEKKHVFHDGQKAGCNISDSNMCIDFCLPK